MNELQRFVIQDILLIDICYGQNSRKLYTIAELVEASCDDDCQC